MEPNFCLSNRGRRREILEGFGKSVSIAKSLSATHLVVTTGNALADESFSVTRERIVRILRDLGRSAQDAGMTLLVEPLNCLVEHPGQFLSKMSDAADLVEAVDSPALRILMDIYHQQITEGNIISNIHKYIDLIGHFHCAGAPGRNELSSGELNYSAIFQAIATTGYRRYVGLEFRPLHGSDEALYEAMNLAHRDRASA
jgi:hydroxypyruvate isomerase